MVLAELRVGPVIATDATINVQRADKTGASVVTDAHAKYQEAVLRGNVFHASMQAGASLGTALTATAVTLTLYNPSGSGKNLVLLECDVGITTGISAAGTAVLVYAINVNQTAAAPTATTAGVVRNCLLNSTTGVGVAYTAATLPAAPVIAKIQSAYRIIGATPVSEYGVIPNDIVDGKIILPPNTAVTIQSIGSAISGIVSFLWEEIAI